MSTKKSETLTRVPREGIAKRERKLKMAEDRMLDVSVEDMLGERGGASLEVEYRERRLDRPKRGKSERKYE